MRTAVVAAGGLALVWLYAHKRRQRALAEPSLVVEPLPPSSSDALEALLKDFVGDEATPGLFYQVQADDTLLGVAGSALNSIGPHSAAARLSYAYCLQSSPGWNMRLYGTPSTSNAFGSELLVPGKNTGVRVAFRARNADALELMLAGRLPRMAVDPISGAPLPGKGASYGLLWLPPVDPQSLALGQPTCAPYSWSDGSSTIDPPPELLSQLSA
jgi:hypothetical protein